MGGLGRRPPGGASPPYHSGMKEQMDTKETNIDLLRQCAIRHNVTKIVLNSVRNNTDTKNANTLLDALFKQMDDSVKQIIDLLNSRNQA